MTATNWFINTPVCCPSRGEILSGRYFHNIMSADGSGCMHIDEDKVNPNQYGYQLGRAGYTVAYFGIYIGPSLGSLGGARMCFKADSPDLFRLHRKVPESDDAERAFPGFRL